MAILKTLQLKNTRDDEWDKVLIARKTLPITKPLKIFIVNDFPLASMSQRGYLFGVVIKIIADETGEEPMKLYELFKEAFGDPAYVEEVKIGEWRLSTKLYTTKVMGSFTEKVVLWGREAGYRIPDPDQVPIDLYLKYMT